MNSINVLYCQWCLGVLAGLLLTSACTSSNSGSSAACTASYTPTAASGNGGTGANHMTVTISGSTNCEINGSNPSNYPNKPCVQVKICEKETTNCQTIPNILLDTGSFGLRVFASLLTVSTTPAASCSDGGTLAECVNFGDLSSEWGEVAVADVQLGSEPPISVPMQLINANYPGAPANCTSAESYPDTDPAEAGFNGILGVGQLAQDCGSDCVSNTDAGYYYSCNNGTCNPATVNLNAQLTNPVALLPLDNNGVVLNFMSITTGSTSPGSGDLYLGIGTQANNAPTGSAISNVLFSPYNSNFGTDTINTTINNYGSGLPGFLDSGTNTLGIPPASQILSTDCGGCTSGSCGCLTGFFCPNSTTTVGAVNYSATTGTTSSFNISVGNANNLLLFDGECNQQSGTYLVSPTLASDTTFGESSPYADWGLPFFYGRMVFVGIQSTSSTLGTGPYWAY